MVGIHRFVSKASIHAGNLYGMFAVVLSLFTFFSFTSAKAAVDGSDTESSSQYVHEIQSPRIEGDSLLIQGKLDSHIYDYIAYEWQKLKKLKYVDLNSLGGNSEQAMLISRKIRQLGLITRVRSGSVCASACISLFGAGVERHIAADAWLGVHGARGGQSHIQKFYNLCHDNDRWMLDKKECQNFVRGWYADAKKVTLEFFGVLEQYGISSELRKTYFSLPLESDWTENFNVLQIVDWVLQPETALSFNLATRIL